MARTLAVQDFGLTAHCDDEFLSEVEPSTLLHVALLAAVGKKRE